MHAIFLAATLMGHAGLPPACAIDRSIQTQASQTAGPQQLGDLPQGRLTRAVMLSVGQCTVFEVRQPDGLQPGAWVMKVAGPVRTQTAALRSDAGR